MGAKQRHDKDPLSSGLDALKVPLGTVLTEPISVGRSGREWRLHLQAHRVAISEDSPSGIEIKRFFSDEVVVIRQTCEFLREHAPSVYKDIYNLLRDVRPVDPNTPWSEDICLKRRMARILVKPAARDEKGTESSGIKTEETRRRAPFTFQDLKIDDDHWSIPVHRNPGNYTTRRSGDPEKLSDWELASDIESIQMYLSEYKKLANDVSGRNVWSATYDPGFRDPYYTCMAICIGEAHLPSHFLALVHYGIGLQFMYERSLEWEKRKNPKSVSSDLIDALKDGFRSLARLYREDFCV